MASVWIENRKRPASRESNYYLFWRRGGRNTTREHQRLGNVTDAMARQAKQKKELELTSGIRVDENVGKLTLREFVDQHFLPHREVAPTTKVLTDGLLRRHILPALGDKQISSIDRSDVRELLGTIYDPQTKTGRRATARQILELLKAIFNYGVEEELLPRNPLGKKFRVKRERKPLTALSIDTITKVIAAAPSYWKPLILTAALAGLRWGELVALRWSDVSFESDTIYVDEQLATNDTEIRAPKQRSVRTVDMLPPVKQALMDLALRDVERSKDPQAFVFVTPEDTHPHPRNFMCRVWDRIFRCERCYFLRESARRKCKACGGTGNRPDLPRFKFHHDGGLRHFFGSLLLLLTGNLMYVSLQMGHSSPQVTADVYSHVIRETQKGRLLDREATFGKILIAYGATAPVPTPTTVHSAVRA